MRLPDYWGCGRFDQQSRNNYAAPARRTAVAYALVTGSFIAAYTLVGQAGGVPGLPCRRYLLDWGANLGRALLLTPLNA